TRQHAVLLADQRPAAAMGRRQGGFAGDITGTFVFGEGERQKNHERFVHGGREGRRTRRAGRRLRHGFNSCSTRARFWRALAASGLSGKRAMHASSSSRLCCSRCALTAGSAVARACAKATAASARRSAQKRSGVTARTSAAVLSAAPLSGSDHGAGTDDSGFGRDGAAGTGGGEAGTAGDDGTVGAVGADGDDDRGCAEGAAGPRRSRSQL